MKHAKTVGLLLIIPIGLYAQIPEDINSGDYLLTCWKSVEKIEGGVTLSAKESLQVGYFWGHVLGVSDTLFDEDLVYYPEGATHHQIILVVGKYLDDHPELLHERASRLIRRALIKTFPKRKQ